MRPHRISTCRDRPTSLQLDSTQSMPSNGTRLIRYQRQCHKLQMLVRVQIANAFTTKLTSIQGIETEPMNHGERLYFHEGEQ